MNEMEDSFKGHNDEGSNIEKNDPDDQSIQYPENTQDNSLNNENKEKRKLFVKNSDSSKAKNHQKLSLTEQRQMSFMNQVEKYLVKDKAEKDQQYRFA